MSVDRPQTPRTSLTTRTTCRICGSPELAPVLSLGDQHIAGAFAEPMGPSRSNARSLLSWSDAT